MAFELARRTFGQVIDKAALALGKRYSIEFAADGVAAISGDLLANVKQIVNLAQRKTQDIVGLEKLREPFVVAVTVPVTSSSLTFTKNSAIVTAAAAIFATTDVGRHILDANGVWYKIITRTDASNVVIEIAYPYATVVGADTKVYTLFHKIGTTGVKRLRTFENIVWPGKVSPLSIVDSREIIQDDPYFQQFSSTPRRAARVEYDGSTCILLHPIINAACAFTIWGVRDCAVLTNNTDVSTLPEEYHPLYQAFCVWLVCAEHGAQEQVARARAILETELDSLGLAENPEVDMLMRYSDGGKSILDKMHTYGVSVI